MANAKKVEVELLKSVQLEPGAEPLKPGKHSVSESVAKDLSDRGLVKATETKEKSDK